MVLTAFWGGYRRHDGIRVVLSFSSRWGPLPDALSNQLQMAQEFRRELMFRIRSGVVMLAANGGPI